jgi:hypothetical protein
MKRILKGEISRFIEGELLQKIKTDLRRYKIVSEGDLQSCVYYHLRRFLRKDKNWLIYNKTYFTDNSVYPDIFIGKGKTKVRPKILIELKEKKAVKKSRIQRDAAKIHKLSQLRKLNGYIIYLCRSKTADETATSINEWVRSKYKRRIKVKIINAYDVIQKQKWSKFDKTWRLFAKIRL